MLDQHLPQRSLIDMRTDVVAPPTDAMWEAMRQVKPGWNLYREDRTVNELEELGAELLGKEAAVLVPTCSMANLLALMTLGHRGTQAIFESTAHIVVTEAWGLAYICGLFPRLLIGKHGMVDATAVEEAIVNSQTAHLPGTSIVCLENSHNNAGGIAVTASQTSAITTIAHRYNVPVHVDGARLFNSAVAQRVPAQQLVETADTVAISLNKGLSAPEGALLCGPRAVMETVRLNLKRIGAASLHKAGIFASAGIIALTTMIDRLAEDNARAMQLAQNLAALPGLHIDIETVQTNIVLADIYVPGMSAYKLAELLKEHGVLVNPRSAHRVRFVVHRLIGEEEVQQVTKLIGAVLTRFSP